MEKNDNVKRLFFKSQAFFNRALVVQMFIIVGAAFPGIFWAVMRSSVVLPFSLLLGLLVGVMGMAFVLSCSLRFITWRRQPLPIRFTEEGLCLPHHIGSGKVTEIPYDKVKSLEVRKLPFARLLVIGSAQRSFVYPVSALAIEPQELISELATCLQSFPAGQQCWTKCQPQQQLAAVLMQYRPIATYVLAALITCIYGIEWLTGSIESPMGLAALGGNVPLWVKEGEISRLFTANFLHLNFAHLICNLVGLLSLGEILEKLVGTRKFLLVYLLASLTGSVTSTVFGGTLVSVGASTAIFGLLGAMAWVNWRLWNRLPPGFNQSLMWWGLIMGLNVALPLIIPAVDWRAHVGGFIGGILSAILLLSPSAISAEHSGDEKGIQKLVEKWRTARFAERGLLAALVLANVAAALQVGWGYKTRDQQVERLLNELSVSADISGSLANTIGWAVVLDSMSTPTHIELARKMMQSDIDAIINGTSSLSVKNKAAHLDTYASLLFLGGKYQEATILELDALKFNNKPSFASQYARFLQAYFQRNGVLLTGDALSTDVKLQQEKVNESSVAVKLIRGADSHGPRTATITVSRGTARLGYFFCQFNRARELALPTDNSVFETDIHDVSFNVQMIDAENFDPAIGDSCRMRRVDGKDSIPHG